jgi:thiamine-phosphate pyrophosphorylase
VLEFGYEFDMNNKNITPRSYRLIDASLNRAAEGLRYMEDIARFLLDDKGLTEQLKGLRHSIIPGDWAFQSCLLDARDSNNDVGADIVATGRPEERDLLSSVVANARRAQEAIRTLAEFARVENYSPDLTTTKLEIARFDLYTIEKILLDRLTRKRKKESIKGLYVVIDTQALSKKTHINVTRQAIRGGAKIIQLRDKIHDRGELLPIAKEMKKVCAESGALFIINDFFDLAMAVEADGVHVGQTDLPVATVRKFTSMGMLIGCSVYNSEQAIKAQNEGADYIAVGAIFPTPTKKITVVGLETLKEIKKAVSVPVVAIGGICADNAYRVRKTGADSIAVISAVVNAKSPESAAKELILKFEGKNG